MDSGIYFSCLNSHLKICSRYHFHCGQQNYQYLSLFLLTMKNFSVVPSDTIRNHQTNSSTSKNAYQFSKQRRFPQPNPECKIAFYSNDSQLSHRKTSFGYGNKSDFTEDLTASPGATKYMHKSLFEDSKSKGKSFGLSRDKIPDRSYLIPQLHKIPGPGNYENQVKTRMSQSFTMRPQTIDFIEVKKTNKKTPGPGEYKQIDLDPKTGRFAISKFGDAKFSKINANNPRFATIKQTPGPLSYREGDSLAGNAKYVLATHRGNGTRIFDHTARTTFTDRVSSREKKVPGPGYYEMRTQFGVYGDSKYYKTLGSFKSTIDSK